MFPFNTEYLAPKKIVMSRAEIKKFQNNLTQTVFIVSIMTVVKISLKM